LEKNKNFSLNKIYKIISTYPKYYFFLLNDWRNEQIKTNRKCDFIFLSRTTARRYKKHGSFYDIFVDPILDQLQKSGFKSLTLERATNNQYKFPRYRPSLNIEQKINKIMFTNYMMNKIKIKTIPDWIKECFDWFKDNCDDSLNLKNFIFHLALFEDLVKYFQNIFKMANPKIFFVINWYNLFSMASVFAANRCNIKTVDLQHGYISDFHYAYCHWTKYPPNGFEILPKYFWTWGKVFSDNILDTNKQMISVKNVIIGGNLWINKWLDNDGLFDNELKQARGLKKLGSKVILITLQRLVPIEKIIDLVKSSPKEWVYLLRVHPSMLNKLKEIQSLFREIKNNNIEFEMSSKIPLYALFQVCDVHITGWSSSSVEAIPFGLHTIVIDHEGRESYEKCIDNGFITFATQKDEIIRIIKKTSRRKVQKKENDIFSSDISVEKNIKIILDG